MAENSQIAWTDHTFNPWWGCTKVSPGCANCYAAALNNRFKKCVWGPNGTRARMGPDEWKKPHRWNRKAARTGNRIQEFCASMADVFEDRPELEPWRKDLWKLIDETPCLDWLLLTKRPEKGAVAGPCGSVPGEVT